MKNENEIITLKFEEEFMKTIKELKDYNKDDNVPNFFDYISNLKTNNNKENYFPSGLEEYINVLRLAKDTDDIFTVKYKDSCIYFGPNNIELELTKDKPKKHLKKLVKKVVYKYLNHDFIVNNNSDKSILSKLMLFNSELNRLKRFIKTFYVENKDSNKTVSAEINSNDLVNVLKVVLEDIPSYDVKLVKYKKFNFYKINTKELSEIDTDLRHCDLEYKIIEFLDIFKIEVIHGYNELYIPLNEESKKLDYNEIKCIIMKSN